MKCKGFFIIPFLMIVMADISEQSQLDFRSAYKDDLYESVLNETLCEQQLIYLLNDTLGYQFIDASGKIPSGILTGNINDLGDYYQCLSIDQLVTDGGEEMEIQGKYCTITIKPENITIPQLPDIPDFTFPPFPPGGSNPDEEEVDEENVDEATKTLREYNALRTYALGVAGIIEPVDRVSPAQISLSRGSTLGICVPKVCTPTQAINFYQDQIPLLNFTFREFYCRLPNDKPFATADIVATVIFGLIGFFIIISTTYDLCHIFWFKRDPKSANTLFCSFSIYTNTRRFLTFKSTPGALECVDGIRAISMLWVVVGHSYVFTLLTYIHNAQDTIAWLSKFTSVWINSAPITVDTFFCMSGILVVYTTIGKISRGRFMRTVHLFYINRLLRMFPILAAVVLLQASYFNHFSDGPFWMNVSRQVVNCRTWWWSILLHVQNYVNPTEICIPQTWYLSVDVQLYFFCPLVLIFLFGREMIGWIALITIVVASLISSSVISFTNDFSAALFNPSRVGDFGNYAQDYYINTLARAPPFFVGMMYGYLLHLCRDKQLKLTKFMKLCIIVLWILAFAMMAFCIFSMYPVMQRNHDAQLFDNFLNSYMRAIWACGLGWLIFACVHGYGGPINWFLSLQMWKLPARLSFGMYMLHVSIIMMANSSWVKTHYFNDGETMYRFFSDVTITFLAAFILCITIDAPFSTLQKLLLGGGKRRPKPKTESLENIVTDEPHIIKTSL